jgi:hypothetical protein
MVSRILSGFGLVAFAAFSAFHCWSLEQVAADFVPAWATVLEILLLLMWMSGIAILLLAVKNHKLIACMMTVFFYVMIVLFLGTRVLDGVPSKIADGNWRDPYHRLTPGAKYVLHNHGNVARVLSEVEYNRYSHFAGAYLSAGFMLVATAVCLFPLDHNGQLRGPRRLRRLDDVPPVAIDHCPLCGCDIPSHVAGHWPPWCPHCGASTAPPSTAATDTLATL